KRRRIYPVQIHRRGPQGDGEGKRAVIDLSGGYWLGEETQRFGFSRMSVIQIIIYVCYQLEGVSAEVIESKLAFLVGSHEIGRWKGRYGAVSKIAIQHHRHIFCRFARKSVGNHPVKAQGIEPFTRTKYKLEILYGIGLRYILHRSAQIDDVRGILLQLLLFVKVDNQRSALQVVLRPLFERGTDENLIKGIFELHPFVKTDHYFLWGKIGLGGRG